MKTRPAAQFVGVWGVEVSNVMSCMRFRDHNIGSTREIPVRARNPVTGEAIDITGYQYRIIVQRELDDSEADYEVDITHTVGDSDKDDGPGGWAFPTIASDAQASLTEGDKYVCVIRTIPGTEPLNVLIEGPFRWRCRKIVK